MGEPGRRDVVDRGERLRRLFVVGQVGVEQDQIELLEQLPRQVEAGVGTLM
jgi:hypothetical protein